MKPKALVVDDNPVGAEGLTALLQAAGWEAECVPGAEEALARLLSYRADVLVLDQLLGGMEGLELVQILRDDPATARLPVLFFTAASDAEVTRLEAMTKVLAPLRVMRKAKDQPEAITAALAELMKGGAS